MVIDDTEVQFQISIKIPLAKDLFDSGFDIFVAYTNRSFWQLYNNKISSPFRETNYEPEVWTQQRSKVDFWGVKESVKMFGLAHQSNGRSGRLSRSWNRVYVQYMLKKKSLLLSLKVWQRIQESFEKDDNPDILAGHLKRIPVL